MNSEENNDSCNQTIILALPLGSPLLDEFGCKVGLCFGSSVRVILLGG